MPSLDLHWKFNNTLVDEEQGLTGTGYLFSYAPGQVDRAISLKELFSRVVITPDSYINNMWNGGRTLMLWVKPTTGSETRLSLIEKSFDNGWSMPFGYIVSSKLDLQFIQQFSISAGAWDTDTGLTIGSWNHVTLTYDSSSTGNDPQFYINGSPITSTELVTPSGSPDNDTAYSIVIGGTSGSQNPDCLVDEVKIFTSALTDVEVQSEYLSYFTFNEGTRGTKDLRSDYPYELGLTARTTRQTGKRFLYPTEKSLLKGFQRRKNGI